MRILDPERQSLIMGNIRTVIKDAGFLFENDWARVISGEEEGIFGWLSVQHLLKTLDSS